MIDMTAEVMVTSSVLISATLFLRKLLKGKISPRLQYALWLLVLVRLLLLFPLFPSAVSVMNRIPMPSGSRSAAEAGRLSHTDYITGETDGAGETAENPEESRAPVSSAEGEIQNGKMGKRSTERILHGVWYAGMAGVSIWLLLSNAVFCRRLRKRRSPYVCRETARTVYLSDAAGAPCVCGIFRPVIYLTKQAAADSVRLRHILAHEEAHIRHKDYIWNVMRGICIAVHWFNPLVWAAAIVSRRDAEAACDDAAIRTLGEAERYSYGRTLIHMLAVKKQGGLFCEAAMITGGEKSMKERIQLIANRPKASRAAVLILAICMLAAAGCTFTGSRTQSPTPPEAAVLYPLKTDYIGNAAADMKLLNALKIKEKVGDFTIALQTDAAPYGITVHFTALAMKSPTEEKVNTEMTKHAAVFLALVGNAEIFSWSYSIGETEQFYSVTAESLGISDIKSYGTSEETLSVLLQAFRAQEGALPAVQIAQASDLEGVSMSLQAVFLDDDGKLKANVLWNHTGECRGLTFGELFTLYQRSGDEWKAYPLKEGYAFHLIGYLVSGQRSHQYDLSVYTEELRRGETYKLQAYVSGDDGVQHAFSVVFELGAEPAAVL